MIVSWVKRLAEGRGIAEVRYLTAGQAAEELGVSLASLYGWIGHAVEQYEGGSLIRPRARYVGEQS